MTKNLHFKAVVTAIFLFFLNTSVLVGNDAAGRPLVSAQLLEAGGLKLLWQSKLPVKENESLEKLYAVENRIYALTGSNYLVCLNRETGKVIFSRQLVEPGFPVFGLQQYGDEIFCIAGNKLFQINPEFGTDLTVSRLKLNAICPAGRNSSFFYIAASDRRLHALRSSDRTPIFKVSAENESMITSVLASEVFVFFATDAGDCISITADGPKRLWQFNAAGGIVGPVVRDGNHLFLASKDTNLYNLNIFNGQLVWKYPSGAVLGKSPRVTGKTVYQYVPDKGLAAIDKKTGSVIWQLAEGVDLLSESEGKAYVITNTGTMAVLDNTQAGRMYSINFAAVSRYTTNAADSKIYIASKDGKINCLIPVE